MDLNRVKELIVETLNKAREALSGLSSRILPLASELIDRYLGPLLNRFPEEKRRLVLLGLGGAVVLFLVLIITLIASLGGSRETPAPDIITGAGILPEQLFIPAEPDFVPEFILEREPRRFWTMEDIRPYWRHPGFPELWRDEVRSAVDKLMEGVK